MLLKGVRPLAEDEGFEATASRELDTDPPEVDCPEELSVVDNSELDTDLDTDPSEVDCPEELSVVDSPQFATNTKDFLSTV